MDTLKRLVDDVGQEKAADMLGVSQGMVSQVLLGNKQFSAEKSVEIEIRMRRSKYPITRGELRPDLFGRAA